MYQIDVMTLFPETVEAVLRDSVIGRARERGVIDFRAWQIRDYTTNRQKQTDDYPYGGGRGCIMYAQPLADCRRAICADAGREIHTIYLSPAGRRFTQEDAKRLSREYDRLILVCGHYEGVDERFIESCVDEEISLGDFVLTGGEIPALAVADAVFRLVPGVLPDEECLTEESHWDGLLEYPQYTRPETWDGRRVPEILLSGHHENIRKWRRRMSLLRTRSRRPDMFEKLTPDKSDAELMKDEI
ncbi:MAG: tRNA (guanosine(37)-N1)-methyltransferase TrmD [Oscillospiraceae bacterium]|jgi:tRNA (guanine37-N1)-methyltransferase|nr:tRNA (guanosine(37)-N1)-methyltransferase TrmD [Oscillospiraceae bacterium]